jgi:hypothetical protein
MTRTHFRQFIQLCLVGLMAVGSLGRAQDESPHLSGILATLVGGSGPATALGPPPGGGMGGMGPGVGAGGAPQGGQDPTAPPPMESLTSAGQALVKSYEAFRDPAHRCVSLSGDALFGTPYPWEIVQTENMIYILHEVHHEVRRIFMDGREHPRSDDWPESAIGYSIGSWDDQTLVVETRLLAETIQGGKPRSSERYFVERYTRSPDGNVLMGEITIYDPVYYKEPIRQQRVFRYEPDEEILEYNCDPDSYYRDLHTQGVLDEYWHLN